MRIEIRLVTFRIYVTGGIHNKEIVMNLTDLTVHVEKKPNCVETSV